MSRIFRPATALAALATLLGLVACQQPPGPLDPARIEALAAGGPALFTGTPEQPGLVGLEGFYLGQPEAEAMVLLQKVCPTLDVYEGGWRHQQAVFRGCMLADEGANSPSVRVGFWPPERRVVTTLEVRQHQYEQDTIRAQFARFAPPVTAENVRRGFMTVESERLRVVADWDEGLQARTHVTLGFQEDVLQGFKPR